jgi:hypothetical protein
MKVERKKKILSYSWLPTGTYYKNMAIWNFFSLKGGVLGLIFSPQKILSIGRNHIFQVEI